MDVIALYTYGEMKEKLGSITVENNISIDDDVYGLVINNVFIPIILNGSDDYLRFDGNCDYLKGLA